MRRHIKIVLIAVNILILLLMSVACVGFEGSPALDDIFTKSIYPGTTNLYQIGNTTLQYNKGYFKDIYLNGALLTPGVVVETDPIFTASPSANITTANITSWSSHPLLTTGTHGVTGTIVGTSDAQALTNKNLTMNNSVSIFWKDTVGALVNVIQLWADNNLHIFDGVSGEIFFWQGSGTTHTMYLWPTGSTNVSTTKDSPTLDFVANYWDTTNKNWEAKIIHDMITAGVVPKSQLQFTINGVPILALINDNGNPSIYGSASPFSMTQATNEPASTANRAGIYAWDLSADNATIGFYTETAVEIALGVASTNRIPIRWNGNTYKLLVEASGFYSPVVSTIRPTIAEGLRVGLVFFNTSTDTWEKCTNLSPETWVTLSSGGAATWGTITGNITTQLDLGGALGTLVPQTTTVNGYALSANITITAGDLSLGNVENTALSSWAGSGNITTLGTIGSGNWNGTAIDDLYISSAATWNAKIGTELDPVFGGSAAYGITSGNTTDWNNKLSNPMTTLGDMIYGGSAPAGTPTRLIGNPNNSKYFLTSTAVGGVAQIPVWTPAGDVSSGATVPASPTVGQFFLHTPTGRTILLEYDGSIWQPIRSYGNTTVYVDSTDGTDAIDKGGAVDAGAVKTVQYAVNLIPGLIGGNVVINVNNETYAEDVVIRGKSRTGDYNITINGILTAHATNTQDSSVQGSGATYGSITDTGEFTNHGNDLLYSSNNAQYAVIKSATANTATIVGYWNAAPTGTYTIYQWATIIQSVNCDESATWIYFNNIKFNSTGQIAVQNQAGGTAYFTRCWFASTTSWATVFAVGFYQYFDTCYFSTTVAAPNLYSGNGWTDIAGSKFTTTNVNGRIIVVSFGFLRFGGNPSYIDGTTGGASKADFGVVASAGAVVNFNGIYVTVSNFENTGVRAEFGSTIFYTVNNQYSGNGANEGVDAAYSYID